MCISFDLLDRSGEWKNDSSGTEGAPSTEPDIPNATTMDQIAASSPPKDSGAKEGGGDRRSRLFRTSSSNPSNKKKQSLSFSITSSSDQQPLQQLQQLTSQLPPKSALDACLSPTNVEPRKTLLDQLAKTFNTEISILPDVVVLVGPQEPHGGISSPKISDLLSRTFKVTFSPQNTAEIKAILTALMNKIQK